MAQSSVDDSFRVSASFSFAQHERGLVRLQPISPTPLAPNPMSPSTPCNSDWEDEILTAAGLHKEGYKLKRAPQEYVSAPKKARFEREPPLSHKKRDDDSLPSTAASTPKSTPSTSPFVEPIPDFDYSNMSVAELREHLGVDGSELAADWERSDLIAVLEHLDRRCMLDLFDFEL